MDANPRPPQLERLIHGTGAKLRLEPRTDRPLTVFLHIPKTAGTTFSEILYDNFPASGIGRTGNVFRGGGGMVPGKLAQLQASAHLITRNVDVLWGHIPYGLAPYLPADARYLTFLRHPVARTLSHYENIRELGIVDRDASLEALVDSGDVVDDLQTRMLCGDETPFGPVTRDMLDRAKRNLTDELHVFGLTERFDESLALMRDRIGLSSILYVQHRVASRRTDGPPPGLVEAAAAVNQHDLELYEHAVRVFDEVIAGEGDSFRLNLEALRRALDPRAERKPAADDLWQLALDGREELLVRNYELAQFRRRYATALDREEMSASLGELQRAMAELTGRVDQFENRVAKMLGVAGPTRARAVAKLERVEEEIAELEAGPDLDEEAALRLDRLRRGAEALRSEAEAPDSAVEPDPDIVLAEPPAPAIPPLVLLDIPESGVRTIGRVLSEAYPTADGVPLVVTEIDPARFPEGSAAVTIVRDPAERMLEHARWLAYRLERDGEAWPLARLLEEGLLQDNLATRMVAGDVPRDAEVGEDDLARAKRNIDERFALACVAERVNESLALLEHVLDVELDPASRRRVDTGTRLEPTEEEQRLLDEHNAVDTQLYTFVVERFELHLHEAGAPLRERLVRFKTKSDRSERARQMREAADAVKLAHARRKLGEETGELVKTTQKQKRPLGPRLSRRPSGDALNVIVRFPNDTCLHLEQDEGSTEVHELGDATRDPVSVLERLDGLGQEPEGLAQGVVAVGVLDREVPEARYFAVLREPVERMLSEYYALVGGSGASAPRPTSKGPRLLPQPGADITLEQMLVDGVYLVDNVYTRLLCGADDPFGVLPEDALERAMENVRDRFELVGIAEYPAESGALLGRALGAHRCELRPPSLDEPTRDGQRILVEQYNLLDVELYLFARKLFLTKVRDAGESIDDRVAELHARRWARARDAFTERFPALTTEPAALEIVRTQAAADSRESQLTIRPAHGEGGSVRLYGFPEAAVDQLADIAAQLDLRLDEPPVQRFENVVYRPRADALYTEDGRSIRESLAHRGPYLADVVRRSPQIVPVSRDLPMYEQPVVYCGVFRRHWGVFLTEGIARLWALFSTHVPNEAQLIESSIASVGYETFEGKPWLPRFLERAGIYEAHFARLPEEVRLREVYIPHPAFAIEGQGFDAQRRAPELVAKRVFGRDGVHAERPVYLSRSLLGDRFKRYLGEELLESALGESGVRVVHPETLSFDDQVALFNEHATFIGGIGSAFHSMLFSLPDRPRRSFVLTNVHGNSLATYFLVDLVKKIDASYVYVEALDRVSAKSTGRIDVGTTMSWLHDLGAL